MFRGTAPAQGPSSSFDLDQDILGLHASLLSIDHKINILADNMLKDPDYTDIVLPTIPSSLEIGLGSGSITVAGGEGLVSATTLPLAAYSDNYIDLNTTGTGANPLDFPPNGSLVYQQAGQYAGTWETSVEALTTQSPINLSDSVVFMMRWTAQYPSGMAWGPGLFDSTGNGYIFQASNGGGAIYRATNWAISGYPLTSIINNTANISGNHTFIVQAQGIYGPGNSFTWRLALSIDNASGIVASFTDRDGVMNPDAVFPGFSSSGGSVFLSGWYWFKLGYTPVVGWSCISVPTGSPAPLVQLNGRRLYQITTDTAPLTIIDLFDQNTLAARVAYLRDILNSIQRAYF